MGRATAATRAVTQSANSIAALRAIESERDDGIVRDPWARELAGARAMARADARGEDGDKGRIAVRTKFFDDFVRTATATIASARTDGKATAGRRAQVVLLGAGYDTRSWRTRAASEEARARTSVYEVDVEEVLARKREVVGEARLTLGAERREVASDIAEDDWVGALRAAGMSTELPTVWVLEGLLYYLSPRCAKKTLALCHRSCGPGSALAVSVVNAPSLRRARREPLARKFLRVFGRAAPKTARQCWKSSCDVPPEAYFAPWRLDACAQLGDDALHYGRWTGATPTPFAADAKTYRRDPTPRTFYVAASK